MKNILLTLIVLSFTVVTASALEPLILEPLGGYGYAQSAGYKYQEAQANENSITSAVNQTVEPQVKKPQYASNMIPQNAAAEGLPVTRKTPSNRIKIETKQGSRTNTQWNPGGKGTRSYF